MPHRRRTSALPASIFLIALLACGLTVPGAASARRLETREGARRGVIPAAEGSSAPEAPNPEAPAGSPTPPPSPPKGGEGTRRERLAAVPRGCSTSATASSPHISAGQTVTLSGVVTCASGELSETAVTVYERVRGAGAPTTTEVGSAQLGADGAYELTTEPITSDCVLLVRPISGRGTRVAIKVSPSVTLQSPSAPAEPAGHGAHAATAPGSWTFTGTVTPAASGTRVMLQRRYGNPGERWRTFAVGRVGEEGRYSITHRLLIQGEVSVRALARPKGDTLTASEAVSFAVPGTQNAALTILSSADPAVAGSHVAISGVAGGPAGQQVTLSARTHGHGFATVATTSTEATGAYTFNVSPAVNTSYRVSDTTGVSATLFEGVTDALTSAPPAGTLSAGATIAISGTALPAPAGTKVRLERGNSSGLSFHTVATGTVDASGAFSIDVSFPFAGSYVLRVSISAGLETVAASGEPFTVTVTPAV